MSLLNISDGDGASAQIFSHASVSVSEFFKAPVRRPPCECVDCQGSFFTVEAQSLFPSFYRHRFSNAEAVSRARAFTDEIHRHTAALKQRLSVSADLLMSRWDRQRRVGRESLLRDAALGLEEQQWIIPRFNFMRHMYHVGRRGLKRRQLLLPWLNVQVLKTNPAVLFALLHYRTFYSPDCWATFDSRQLNLSWAARRFDVDHSSCSIVMHGPNYGSVVEWEEKAAHRYDTLGFPRAILVLEAQSILMATLHTIVDMILEGVDTSQAPRIEKWTALVNNAAFRDRGVVEFWSPYINQAFSRPGFDSDRLLSLAKARREATGDHLHHLQSDAAYLRRYLTILFATGLFKKSDDAQRRIIVAEQFRYEISAHH